MSAHAPEPVDSPEPAATAERAPRRRVLLTTDCGTEMDDQWALAHLALSPEWDLVGVVTTHAPNLAGSAAERTAEAAREVLRRVAPGCGVEVRAGSSVPLPDARTPLANRGVERILERAAVRGPEGRLTVLAIGAATDVASALLADPTLAERIEVVAMGFQGRSVGGDEWNVKNDPAAWRVLLGSRVPLTVGAADVCKRRLLMTGERACDRFAGRGPVGRYLADLLIEWLGANGATASLVTGRSDAWPVWDEIVVAHLLGLSAVRRHPRPLLREDLTFGSRSDAAADRGIDWITDVDDAGLWEDLAGKLLPGGR
ncbi:MAG: nucleoside hydrolase [Chthonomonadales bacterium]|nr:nucleoside hydrolase [Chthonomonadales bacterium]